MRRYIGVGTLILAAGYTDTSPAFKNSKFWPVIPKVAGIFMGIVRSARHDTRRCPGPFAYAALAGPQSQGIQLTLE